MKCTFFLTLFCSYHLMAQTPLPVTEYKGTNPALPLVCYLTGDGGLNDFSKGLIKAWNTSGYSVIVLNSKSYFWKKQTPEHAAADVNGLLEKYLAAWKCSSALLTGYSLGADVLPFIQNRLPATLTGRLSKLVMISPSNTTDFEVHLFYGSSGSSVPAEINKLTRPALVFLGQEEKDTPETAIHNGNVTVIKLPGDHHYNDAAATVVQQIIKRL